MQLQVRTMEKIEFYYPEKAVDFIKIYVWDIGMGWFDLRINT